MNGHNSATIEAKVTQSHPAPAGPFRIGTRGSALALWQANTVRNDLMATHGIGPDQVSISVIRTSGDAIRDRRLAEAGGKGLFVKELEVALLSGEIDCAVHSLKDVPTILPTGLALAAYLRREDPRDALIARNVLNFDALPRGARFGTASMRREALARGLRPDLDVVLLRGNVDTRLASVEKGDLDGTLLALAGLKRLGWAHRACQVLDPAVFVPAVGQGVVVIETRHDDTPAQQIVSALDHRETRIAAEAERAFLAWLDGSCQSPIGGYARIEKGRLRLSARLMSPDGRESAAAEVTGPILDPVDVGERAANHVLEAASPALLAVLEETP